MEPTQASSSEPTTPPPPKQARDWFGYLFTTVIGIIATVIVAWYQLFATQKEVAAAELERARSVKQTAVAIVEEHVLNGKKLETTRLARLIDQRRRDETISIPISVSEVVEQAEFNIASSHHLSVDRKEDIKPLFDAFYSDLASRSFSAFPAGTANADLLNEIAKKIQDGKSSEAISTLKRLEESHAKDLSEASRLAKPGILEAFREFTSSPWKLSALVLAYVALFYATLRLRRSARIRKRRAPFL